MARIENKNALITGCNRGIGRAVMEKFMQEGANIIACTRVLTPELKTYYEESKEKYGISIYPVVIDLADESSVNNAVKMICSLKLPIHVLVNNAGIACFDGLMHLSLEKLKSVFQVNYFSPILLIKGLVFQMMKAKSASVINMASVAGIEGSAGNCAYGASKSSLILATKTLSKEFSKAKIRVNAIAPSIVSTDMSAGINENIVKQQLSITAIDRPSTPEEIANTALFLASDESSYITGQVIRVDGGM